MVQATLQSLSSLSSVAPSILWLLFFCFCTLFLVLEMTQLHTHTHTHIHTQAYVGIEHETFALIPYSRYPTASLYIWSCAVCMYVCMCLSIAVIYAIGLLSLSLSFSGFKTVYRRGIPCSTTTAAAFDHAEEHLLLPPLRASPSSLPSPSPPPRADRVEAPSPPPSGAPFAASPAYGCPTRSSATAPNCCAAPTPAGAPLRRRSYRGRRAASCPPPAPPPFLQCCQCGRCVSRRVNCVAAETV